MPNHTNLDPLSHWSWGDLNPIMTAISAKRLNEGTALGSLKAANLSAYEQNILQGIHHFKAVVLQVMAQEIASVCWATVPFADENSGEDFSKPMRIEVVAMIPELQGAILPTPKNILGPPELIDYEAIRRFPTFVGKDPNVAAQGIPKPGDVVWVDFGNRDNFQDPLYLGPVAGLQAVSPGFVTGTDRYGRPCTPNMPEMSKVDAPQAGGSVNVPTAGSELGDVDPVEDTPPAPEVVPCEINSSTTTVGARDLGGNPPNIAEYTTVVLLPASPYVAKRVFLNVFGNFDKNNAVPVASTPGRNGRARTELVHPLVRTRLTLLNAAWVAEAAAAGAAAKHQGPFLVVSGLRPHGMERYKWLNKPHRWASQKVGTHKKGPQLGPVKLTAAYNQNSSNTPANMKRLFEAYLVDEYGSLKLGRDYRAWSSPHETGLAVDFGNNGFSTNSNKEDQMKATPAWKWLKANAYKYGFSPYYTEAWHWEVLVPLENYQTGVEFVTDGNFAVYPEEKLNKSPQHTTYARHWRYNILANKIA